MQLVKKFPAFHGTPRFITALTSVRQLSLSWASPIQSIYPHSTSWRSILILSTHLHLGLPSGLFPSGFPTKKFSAFHGTRRFITALTSVCHLSLSWASPIQSIYPHPTLWRSVLILSTHLHLGLLSGSFPPVSPPRPYTAPFPHPYAPHAQPISFFSILSPAQYWVRTTIYP